MKLLTEIKKQINLRNILLLGVNVLLIVSVICCLARANTFSNTLHSQQAAKTWQGDSELRFSQVSAFLPVTATVDELAVLSFRSTFNAKLATAGVEAPEEGQLWTDAYSTSAKLNVSSVRTSSEVTAMAVGGNFFQFHPYYLMSGSYISADDLMKDRVVLEYDLAWKLFGSASLEGMTVTINGKNYYVAGVIQRETDKFSQKAYDGGPMIFMSFSAYQEILGEEKTATVSCYELAMQEPITGFTQALVKDNFAASNGVVVENSTRFDFTPIFNIFKNFGDRSIQKNPVVYPYWENAARIAEVNIARLWVVIAILGIFPFICLVLIVIFLIKYLIRKLKQGKTMAKDAWEDRYAIMEGLKEKYTKPNDKQEDEVSEPPTFEEIFGAQQAAAAEVEHEKQAKIRVRKAQEKERIKREKYLARKEKNIAKHKKKDKKTAPRALSSEDQISEAFKDDSLDSLDVSLDPLDVSLDVENIVREIMNENKQETK